mmetsp:Transcript_21055/g.43333  ORF Transcript_21055/g.43333 Transcript_21055/m.43333 type:complete len:202 (+) Transcript_21055:226-831(+)
MAAKSSRRDQLGKQNRHDQRGNQTKLDGRHKGYDAGGCWMAKLVSKNLVGQPQEKIVGLALGIIDGCLVEASLIGNDISLLVALSGDPLGWLPQQRVGRLFVATGESRGFTVRLFLRRRIASSVICIGFDNNPSPRKIPVDSQMRTVERGGLCQQQRKCYHHDGNSNHDSTKRIGFVRILPHQKRTLSVLHLVGFRVGSKH